MVGVARIRYSLALTQATRVRVPAELTQLPFAAPCSSHLPAADSFFWNMKRSDLTASTTQHIFFPCRQAFLTASTILHAFVFRQKIKRQLGPESSQKTPKRTVTDTDFSPNAWPARLAQSVECKALNLLVVGRARWVLLSYSESSCKFLLIMQ